MFTLAHELAHLWLGQPRAAPTWSRRAVRRADRALVQPGRRRAAGAAARQSARRSIDRERGAAATSCSAWRGASRSARWSSCAASTMRALMTQRGLLEQPTGAELERLRARPNGRRRRLLPDAWRADRQALCPGARRQHARGPDPRSRRPSGCSASRRWRRSTSWGAAWESCCDGLPARRQRLHPAKNLHYGLDFCPAFWDWLIARNAAGTVFSIEKVGDELEAGRGRARRAGPRRSGQRASSCSPTAALVPALGAGQRLGHEPALRAGGREHLPAGGRLLPGGARAGP